MEEWREENVSHGFLFKCLSRDDLILLAIIAWIKIVSPPIFVWFDFYKASLVLLSSTADSGVCSCEESRESA